MYFSLLCLVAQSCPILWDPMDCSLPGTSVHRIFQARVLEWVAIPFSRGSSWPRDRIPVFCTAGRFLTIWATREVPVVPENGLNILLQSSERPRRAFHEKFMCKLKYEWCVPKWKNCILSWGIKNEFTYGFPPNFYVEIRYINLYNLIHDACNCSLHFFSVWKWN